MNGEKPPGKWYMLKYSLLYYSKWSTIIATAGGCRLCHNYCLQRLSATLHIYRRLYNSQGALVPAKPRPERWKVSLTLKVPQGAPRPPYRWSSQAHRGFAGWRMLLPAFWRWGGGAGAHCGLRFWSHFMSAWETGCTSYSYEHYVNSVTLFRVELRRLQNSRLNINNFDWCMWEEKKCKKGIKLTTVLPLKFSQNKDFKRVPSQCVSTCKDKKNI